MIHFLFLITTNKIVININV